MSDHCDALAQWNTNSGQEASEHSDGVDLGAVQGG